MSHPIVPDSAPSGKSNRTQILNGWVEDADVTLESLQSWLSQLQSWQQTIITPEAFRRACHSLELAQLAGWAEALGVAELQATLVDNPAQLLERSIHQTEQTRHILQVWRASLDSWRHQPVSLADFEATVAMLRQVNLESWLAEHGDFLRGIVVRQE